MWRYMWMHLGTYIMPALVIFSIVLSYFYDSSAAFWKVLDSTLEARLAFGKQGFEDFGVKLFGQKIDMIGNGGTTKYQGEYFFLDCSYVNILLTWGLILFCIVIGIHIYICNKNKQDEYFSVCNRNYCNQLCDRSAFNGDWIQSIPAGASHFTGALLR